MKRKILKTKHTVKSLVLFSLLILTQNLLHSQVLTRILGEDEFIYEYIPWYFEETPQTIEVPHIDVQAVLEEDKKDTTITVRYGVKQPLNLSTENGNLYEFGNYSVWKLLIHSDSAKSLNFQISGLSLPVGSSMFIYGFDAKMIHGPIRQENIYQGVYNSDVVFGDSAYIEVFLPNSTSNDFTITVDNVIHGIRMEGDLSKAFGDSGECNNNVICEEGDDWRNEISAVCLILASSEPGDELCTGTLITNECNDFTPYVLTANHCVSGQDPSNWVFRFNYESATCENTVAPHKSTWFSVSGATVRASWSNSDFALLQLNSPVNGDVSFAGWNRLNTIPPNSTCIHHPRGDVKKISFDDQSPTVNGLFHTVVWDDGTTEPGSSGSALFDDNRLIIGQLQGGSASCTNPSGTDDYGRIFDSWTGGGTNSTRLSNWLGGINNPGSVNTLLPPSISGSDFVCTNIRTYELNNPIPNYTVSWTVSPSSLFGSPTSGSGTTATLWAANSSVQGSATLTYTLENTDCGSQTFSKQIWVGKPMITGIQVPECFDPGENYVLIADAEGGSEFVWTFPACPNGTPPIGTPDPDCWYNYTGNSQQVYVYTGQQGGSISVWVTNPCGTSSINVPIGEFCDETPGEDVIYRSDDGERTIEESTSNNSISVFPNPTSEYIKVVLDDSTYAKDTPKAYSFYDISGRNMYSSTNTGNRQTINVKGFPTGVCYLKIVYKEEVNFIKVIIQ